jgi:solute carrier family 12 (sodium/potassium/chloride transporter), member 2
VPEPERTGYQFGAFKGVFTPSILTILGVIMYLRFGWVIGNVGLVPTLIIVTLSTAITFFTALSISALATNIQVKGGGAYFIISRALGIEAGAAIGLPLFLAQALSISFYIVGFSESVVQILPFMNMKIIGIVTLVLMFVLALKSADIVLKTQYFILLLIALSLLSFFMGTGDDITPLSSNTPLPKKETFWIVFAVFFPAVTGILAGVSMSGDLKNPEKAIPWGTLAALACSYVIYMAIPIFFVRFVKDHNLFLIDSMIMYKVARWGPLILLGLWGATLSSAIGSLLGAPRTLQAIAKDGIIFRFIGRGFGKNQEPRIALLISFVIALTGILAGDLNMIAPVLSMFFLTTYGLLNLSAGFGRLIGSPAWRPTFRIHWGFSFAGAFGCFAAMFMINPGASFIAIFISVIVYIITKRRRLKTSWGDMKYGILMLIIQFALYKLSTKKPNIESWRPNILVLSGTPTSRWYLIEIADALSHGYGLLTVAAILPEKNISYQRKENMEKTITNYLQERDVKALVKVYLADDVAEGISALIRGYGFGAVEPNTILIGETAEESNLFGFTKLIRMIHENKKNVIIVKEGEIHKDRGKDGQIDIWWGQKEENAGLILALAHLLQTNPLWGKAKMVLKTIVSSADDPTEIEKGLRTFVEQGRLEVSVETVFIHDSNLFSTIEKSSRDSDFIFIGLRSPVPDESVEEYGAYLQSIFQNTKGIPSVAYVLASEDLDFKKIFLSA